MRTHPPTHDTHYEEVIKVKDTLMAEDLCGCRVEQGWLNLCRVNDLLYTVDFRPYEKFSHLPCYKVDLDSIELDDSCGVISINDSEPYLNFQALDVREFNLFQGMCGALPLHYLVSFDGFYYCHYS